MEELKPQYFDFKGFPANGSPEIKDIHTYDYKTGEPLAVPHIEIGGFRKNWPACIPPFYAHERFALRADVVSAIEKAELKGLVAQKTTVSKLNGKAKIDCEVPEYFLVDAPEIAPTAIEVYEVKKVDGRIAGYEFLFFTDSMSDPRIAEIQSRPEFGRHAYRYILTENPKVLDFFSTARSKSYGRIACSLRFVEIARDRQWENIYFQPLDSLSDASDDYRKRPWPPELWYSDNQRRLYS